MGTPVNTYAYGAGGLLERYQHTSSSIPYLVYLFDPNGNPVHRVRSIDPNISSGAAVFVQDMAVYDAQDLLHGDIDTITGGLSCSYLDPVGYQGQTGIYTEIETGNVISLLMREGRDCPKRLLNLVYIRLSVLLADE